MPIGFVVFQVSARLETRNVGVMVYSEDLDYRMRCRKTLPLRLGKEAQEVFEGTEESVRDMIRTVGLRTAIEQILGWSNFLHVESLRTLDMDNLDDGLDRLYQSLVLGRGAPVLGTPIREGYVDAKLGRVLITPAFGV